MAPPTLDTLDPVPAPAVFTLEDLKKMLAELEEEKKKNAPPIPPRGTTVEDQLAAFLAGLPALVLGGMFAWRRFRSGGGAEES